MARRTILRKNTVPHTDQTMGKNASSYKPGGSYASSYNSSDVNNFDKKGKGQIGHERIFLTTTPYPLFLMDRISSHPSEKQMHATFTDNIYSSSSDRATFKIAVKELSTVTLKRLLWSINYYESDYYKEKYDKFSVRPSRVSLSVRKVLKEITGSVNTAHLDTDLDMMGIKYYIDGEEIFYVRRGNSFELDLTPEQQELAFKYGITVKVPARSDEDAAEVAVENVRLKENRTPVTLLTDPSAIVVAKNRATGEVLQQGKATASGSYTDVITTNVETWFQNSSDLQMFAYKNLDSGNVTNVVFQKQTKVKGTVQPHSEVVFKNKEGEVLTSAVSSSTGAIEVVLNGYYEEGTLFFEIAEEEVDLYIDSYSTTIVGSATVNTAIIVRDSSNKIISTSSAVVGNRFSIEMAGIIEEKDVLVTGVNTADISPIDSIVVSSTRTVVEGNTLANASVVTRTVLGNTVLGSTVSGIDGYFESELNRRVSSVKDITIKATVGGSGGYEGEETYSIYAKTETQNIPSTNIGVIVEPDMKVPPAKGPGNPPVSLEPTVTISGGSGKEGTLIEHTVYLSKVKENGSNLKITVSFEGSATSDTSNRISQEAWITNVKKVSIVMRSLLKDWKLWRPEGFQTTLSKVDVTTSTLYTTKFRTLLLGDSENVQSVLSDSVIQIKDKGILSWKIPDTLTVDRDNPKMDKQSLIIDEDYEHLSSKESLGISSESGVELFFEDWFKPELSTKLLLTSYGYQEGLEEVAITKDKASDSFWKSSKTFSELDFKLERTDFLEIEEKVKIENPVLNSKGTTLEITCTVEGTDRIVIMSNNSNSYGSTSGKSFAVVWYGPNSSQELANRVAVVTDDKQLSTTDVMLLSTTEVRSGSSVHIALVAFEGYLRLFIDGQLQTVKTLNKDIDFSYGDKFLIGKSEWYSYVSPHTLTVNDFRYSNLALYTSNFKKPLKYSLRVVPNLQKVNDIKPIYKTGVHCGLRYDRDTNSTRVFAAVTDTYGETFTVTSGVIDCSKWNYIQLANTGSELTLFLNGVANESIRLPYNIRFRDITLSGRDSNNFKGLIDNFRIYSKTRDYSLELKSSELYATLNSNKNTLLRDTNSNIKWKPISNPVIKEEVLSTRRHVIDASTRGFYTESADLLQNPYYFTHTIRFKANSYGGVYNFFKEELSPTETLELQYNATMSLSFYLKVEESSEESLLIDTGVFKIYKENLNGLLYKLKIEINGATVSASIPLKYGEEIPLLFFKKHGFDYIFINDLLQLRENSSSATISKIVVGNFNGGVFNISTYNINNTRTLLTNSLNSSGLEVLVTEVSKEIFLIETTYNELLFNLSSLLFKEGFNTLELKQDNSSLTLSLNGLEAGDFQEKYLKGSNRITVFNTYLQDKALPFDLDYFTTISSQQDATLSIPYDIEVYTNESLYKNVVLNLSSDSTYENFLIDRSANPISKDISYIGVSQALQEPGLFFKNGNIKVEDSPDFDFHEKDFYIEVELKPINSSYEVLAIGEGLGQLVLKTEGNSLKVAINNGRENILDTLLNISENVWNKLQVSKEEDYLKFYLNDKYVSELQLSGDLVIENPKGSLKIGESYNGYLNNLRIVKGYSLSTNFEESSGNTVNFEEYDIYLSDRSIPTLSEFGVANVDGSDGVTLQGTNVFSETSSGFNQSSKLAILLKEDSSLTLPLKEESFRINFDLFSEESPEKGKSNPILKVGSNIVLYIYNNSSNSTSLRIDYTTGYEEVPFPLGVWNKVSVIVREGSVTLQCNLNKTSTFTTNISVKNIILGEGRGDVWESYRDKIYGDVRVTFKDFGLEAYGNNLATTINKEDIVNDFDMESVTTSTLCNINGGANSVKDLLGGAVEVINVSVVDFKGTYFKKLMKMTGNSSIKIRSSNLVGLFKEDSSVTLETSFFYKKDTSFTLAEVKGYWKLSVEASSILLEINNTIFSPDIEIEPMKLYSLAITVEKGEVVFHINKDLYRVERKLSSFQSNSNSLLEIGQGLHGGVEVFKVSNKVLYTKGKSLDNLRRKSHLQLQRGFLIDDGNNPSEWESNGVFDEGLSLDNSYLKNTSVINPEKNPFSLVFKVILDEQPKGVFLEIVAEDFKLSLQAANNQLRLLVEQEETLLNEAVLSTTSLVEGFNVIGITKDFDNILEFTVNNNTSSIELPEVSLKDGSLSLANIKGVLKELSYYEKDIVDIEVTENLLGLDFEKGAIGTEYITTSNGVVFENFGASEVKGLSQSSDSSVSLDGLTTYFSTENSKALNFQENPFELKISIYPTSGVNSFQPILTGNPNENDEVFFIAMIGSEKPSWYEGESNRLVLGKSISSDFVPEILLVTEKPIPFDSWTLLRISRKEDSLQVFLNGSLDRLLSFKGPLNFSKRGCTVGCLPWNIKDTSTYFSGYLDDILSSIRGPFKESGNITSLEGLISGLDFEDVGTSFDIVKTPYKPDYVDSFTNTWSWGRLKSTSEYPYHLTVSAVNEALYFPGESYMYMYNKHFGPGLDMFTLSVDFYVEQVRNCYIFSIDTMYHLRVQNNILYFKLGSTEYNLGAVVLKNWYTFAVSRDSSNKLRLFVNGKTVRVVDNFNNNIEQGYTFEPMVLGRRWAYRTNSGYTYENLVGFIDNFYFERGFCKYTGDYVVFTDKTLKNTYDSLVSFSEKGPEDKNSSLKWSSNGISFIKTMNEFNEIVARNTTTGGFLQSSPHGIDLGVQDFTLEFYFRTSQINSESVLVDLALTDIDQKGLRILQPSTSTASIELLVGSKTSTGWVVKLNTGINSLVTNKTYHLRVTRNIGTLYLYLDGVLKGKAEYLQDIPLNPNYTLFNAISKNKGFNGVIEQFRFKQGQSFSAEESFPKLTGEFK